MLPTHVKEELNTLRRYLASLPSCLPVPDLSNSQSSSYALDNFFLDPEWVEDVGEEGAVNRALEAALGTRNDHDVFQITERGPAIEKLPGLLEYWLEKYPSSFYLGKWLKDGILSAQTCILNNGGSLLPPEVPNIDLSSKIMPSNDPQKKNSSKSNKALQKKPDTKKMTDFIDPEYDDVEEDRDNRAGGIKTLPLLLHISKICRLKSNPEKKRIRCIASAQCGTTWAFPRDRTRILKHVIDCGYVAHIQNGELVAEAVEELAKRDPGQVSRLQERLGKRERSNSIVISDEHDMTSLSQTTPALKKFRPSTVPHKAGQLGKSNSTGSIITQPISGTFKNFQTEGQKELQRNGNDALVRFIVCCGLPPRILRNEEFKAFCETLNNRYHPPSNTTFDDSLVPSYAAAVRIAIEQHLNKAENLTITFDGGQMSKKKFYSVHITTVDRQSFCMELDDSSRLSMTGDYIYELLEKWVKKIGPTRFACVTSDDAANTNKACRLLTTTYPWIFNLADACHNLSNTMKDICNLPEFKPVIEKLRAVLAFMSLSTYTLDHFDNERRKQNISRGLEAIGETRFGTIYWSLESILRGMNALKTVVRNKSIGITSELLHSIFDDDDNVYEFTRDLRRLGAVLMPMARALQCLESRDTDAADVYRYWLVLRLLSG